jgi:tRNA pseudouridine32 synthase/23S rRNA pseudouridine746 synthase
MLPCMDEPRVLHVDPQLLLVDKPPGLLSVPGRGEGELLNLTVQLQRLYPSPSYMAWCRPRPAPSTRPWPPTGRAGPAR